MKLNQLLPALFVLLFAATASAQNKNPFETIGKQGKIITLTKGSYDELFDKNSIQQVGSVLINIRTLKVVKLLPEKVTKSELESNKHSRFLSVDPISANYPMLTPYQFASNRPIDGIDLDGLEYITYTTNIDVTIGPLSKITSAYYVWNNANQHNSTGPLGRGVLYVTNFYSDGKKLANLSKVDFVSRDASIAGFPTEYGNYMGATGLYDVFRGALEYSTFSEKYNYDLPPVCTVDNGAYAHDQGYDKMNAVGANGLFDDWGTTPVDIKAFETWNNFLDKNPVGSIDPFNNQPVTGESRSAAQNAIPLFAHAIGNKMAGISSFMRKNYKSESYIMNTKYNYDLFLKKYMTKDEEGDWIRVRSMWNTSQDKDGNTVYTPKVPEE